MPTAGSHNCLSHTRQCITHGPPRPPAHPQASGKGSNLSDFQRARRLKKLNRMLQSPKAQQMAMALKRCEVIALVCAADAGH